MSDETPETHEPLSPTAPEDIRAPEGAPAPEGAAGSGTATGSAEATAAEGASAAGGATVPMPEAPSAVPAPQSGPPIQARSSVGLLVSKGPAAPGSATATVPAVVGKKQADALKAIQEAGFQVEVLRNPNEAFDAGTISHQLPGAQVSASYGSKVAVIVSAGRAAEAAAMTVLPDLVGKQAAEATELLGSAQLVPSVLEDFSPTVPAGVVMAQEPNAQTLGRKPEKKRRVWLWVLIALLLVGGLAAALILSQPEPAPVEIEVPGIVGMTQEDAEAALAGAGLTAGRISEEATEAAEPGTVVSQDPEAGTLVGEGERVDFIVARALEGVVVPDVVGMTEDEAASALEGAGLAVRSEATYSSEVETGLVVGQSPQAGIRVQAGAEVAISVSKGPQPPANVTVPNVAGKSKAAAENDLAAVGLASAALETYSTSVAAGSVIAQAPAAGSSVAPGTKVVILISKGAAPPTAVMVDVPDVMGMPKAEAVAVLEDAGFEVYAIEVQRADQEPGIVILQVPMVGQQAEQGSTVSIAVTIMPVAPAQ